MISRQKPVYMYETSGEFIQKFETTDECAEFFNKTSDYINHSIKYNGKIRKDGKWYVISRKENENRTDKESNR